MWWDGGGGGLAITGFGTVHSIVGTGMFISSKVPCFSQEQVSCSIFNIGRKSLPFPWVNSSPGLFYGNRTLRTLAEAINLFIEARESGLKDSRPECRSIHIRTNQGRAIFCLLGVEINRQWSVLSGTVCQDDFGPPLLHLNGSRTVAAFRHGFAPD